MAQRDEIARLEAMHAANPEGRVFAHLAEAYRKAGEHERAREVLQAGLQRHPQYASAHVVLGRVLLDLADRPAADSSFRRVLELDPHNMVALRARGDIAHENGDDAEALDFYRELITLDPSDEQAVLRIAEIESRPAEVPGAHAPSEPGFGDVDLASPPVPSAESSAPIEETPPVEYGEAALPPVGETAAAAAADPFQAADFGAVSIDESAATPTPSPATGDVDLGLGGALQPTDLPGARPAAAEPVPAEPVAAEPEVAEPEVAEPVAEALPLLGEPESPTADVPDAVVDLSSMGGHFALPPEEPATGLDLPGYDEIASDATPELRPGEDRRQSGSAEHVVVPTSPADEPAPAPAPSLGTEPDLVDTKAEFDALWTTYDDGAAAALPNVGPELITETIGDLYAQQGLHDRAADVYARLLESRAGDGSLQTKLDAARAAAAVGAAAAPAAPAPLPIPKPAPLVEEPVEAVAEKPTEAVVEPQPVSDVPAPEPEREPEAPATPSLPSSLPWEEPATSALPLPESDPFDLPPMSAEPGDDPFALPAFADAAALEDEPVSSAAPIETPIVPIDDLGLEPVGGGDLLVETPTPAETAAVESFESVESAWTGGAGAAGGTDSPFGWAEPEASPSQATIGEYFDRLIAWAPPTGPAVTPDVVPPFAAEPTPPPEPEPAFAAAPEPTPAFEPAPTRAPVEAVAPPPVFAAPAAPFDDIDALFGEVAKPSTASSLLDDIESLFGTGPAPLDTATPAAAPTPEPEQPAVAEPTAASQPPVAAAEPVAPQPAPAPQSSPDPVAEAGFAWDPFAELAPQAPAPSEAPSVAPSDVASAPAAAAGGGGFEWDPFAELPESEAPAPSAPVETEADSASSDDGDDEDIDMFRAWLQSLKR